MTRRQIFFYSPLGNTYYISPEFNGDRDELQRIGSADSCDKSWDEILEELRDVCSLDKFMEAISRIKGYYHSSLGEDELPGTKLRVLKYPFVPEKKDETYGIVSSVKGPIFFKVFSICDPPAPELSI